MAEIVKARFVGIGKAPAEFQADFIAVYKHEELETPVGYTDEGCIQMVLEGRDEFIEGLRCIDIERYYRAYIERYGTEPKDVKRNVR